MSDLMLVITVAAITFASRVAFLVRPRPAPAGLVGRFLDVFPLALFVAIATSELLAPTGSLEVTPAVAAAAGGIAGAALFRRALLGVLAVGAVAFYAVRALAG
ncbi:MAG: AzlD domain-containing protein [Acidimicrobiia bacterium]|nr:AzlD domain-containing protein [Acidimicrobiia bacterium]